MDRHGHRGGGVLGSSQDPEVQRRPSPFWTHTLSLAVQSSKWKFQNLPPAAVWRRTTAYGPSPAKLLWELEKGGVFARDITTTIFRKPIASSSSTNTDNPWPATLEPDSQTMFENIDIAFGGVISGFWVEPDLGLSSCPGTVNGRKNSNLLITMEKLTRVRQPSDWRGLPFGQYVQTQSCTNVRYTFFFCSHDIRRSPLHRRPFHTLTGVMSDFDNNPTAHNE